MNKYVSGFGLVALIGILVWISGLAAFPTSEYIRGFARAKGVPVASEYKGQQYFGASSDVLQICRRDPLCVGVSDSRYFAADAEQKRGTPVYMEQGVHAGEYAYIKDEYPTVFL
jgi:hypothetical protein